MVYSGSLAGDGTPDLMRSLERLKLERMSLSRANQMEIEMAAIKEDAKSRTEVYAAAAKELAGANDANACAPLAVSILTRRPLAEILALFEQAGRVKNKATPRAITREVIEGLGWGIRELTAGDRREIIDSYPGVHKNLKNITTHQPARFKKQWDALNLGPCLLFSIGHVSAFENGEVHDWAKGSALRVIGIWELRAPEDFEYGPEDPDDFEEVENDGWEFEGGPEGPYDPNDPDDLADEIEAPEQGEEMTEAELAEARAAEKRRIKAERERARRAAKKAAK